MEETLIIERTSDLASFEQSIWQIINNSELTYPNMYFILHNIANNLMESMVHREEE